MSVIVIICIRMQCEKCMEKLFQHFSYSTHSYWLAVRSECSLYASVYRVFSFLLSNKKCIKFLHKKGYFRRFLFRRGDRMNVFTLRMDFLFTWCIHLLTHTVRVDVCALFLFILHLFCICHCFFPCRSFYRSAICSCVLVLLVPYCCLLLFYRFLLCIIYHHHHHHSLLLLNFSIWKKRETFSFSFQFIIFRFCVVVLIVYCECECALCVVICFLLLEMLLLLLGVLVSFVNFFFCFFMRNS